MRSLIIPTPLHAVLELVRTAVVDYVKRKESEKKETGDDLAEKEFLLSLPHDRSMRMMKMIVVVDAAVVIETMMLAADSVVVSKLTTMKAK